MRLERPVSFRCSSDDRASRSWCARGGPQCHSVVEGECKHPCESLVDSVSRPLYAGVMNLQVPSELEAKLTRLAAESGRPVDQVALDVLANSAGHDEWFRSEVEKGACCRPRRPFAGPCRGCVSDGPALSRLMRACRTTVLHSPGSGAYFSAFESECLA